MPNMVNRNSHAVRVRGNDGALRRVLPGQVVKADGQWADNLNETAGVSTASSDEVKAWEAKLDADRTRSVMAGDGSRLSAKLAITPALVEARTIATVAPLQRVVGDDAAPQGPPSGTITTRGLAASSGDPRDLAAFAQGEELVMQGKKIEAPGASDHDVLAGRATQSDIHNAQVDNAAAAEAAAKAVLAGEADADDEKPKPKGGRRAASKASGDAKAESSSSDPTKTDDTKDGK